MADGNPHMKPKTKQHNKSELKWHLNNEDS